MKILFRIFLAVLLSSGIAFAGIDSVSTRRRAESINEKMGSAVINRAITAKLHVSKNGDNTDGSTWGKAYNKIQDALDAASTDINDLTLILIAVATGPTDNYDIDTAGDPTWTGNYEIVGSHRTWVKIKNTDGSATSIMKFTGYVSLKDLNFNLGVDDCNGVIITKGAFRLNRIQFVGSDLTGAATALILDGATGGTTLKNGKAHDVFMTGEPEFMTGLKLDKVASGLFERFRIHECLKAIHIDNAASDENLFSFFDIGDCDDASGIAIDIDAGNEQHFDTIQLHHNTVNIDDDVEDQHYNNMIGEFPIAIEPLGGVNYAGVVVSAGEDTWGADTELRSAAAATKPFKIVGYRFEPSEEKKFVMRFSADSGSTWFDMAMTETKKNKAQGASPGTDFIFNKGTRISASAGCEVAGKTIQIWLEIQEI